MKWVTVDDARPEGDVFQGAQLSALGAAVGLSLTRANSLAGALQQCAEALVTFMGATFARVWTLNEREGVLELQASAGLYTHLNGPHGKVPIGQFKIGRIARDRKPHLTNAVVGDPEVSDQEWARRERMVAFAGHPLIVDDRVVGVIGIFSRHALSDAVLSELASVADHIALGIERSRSTEALRTAEERMRFALEAAGIGIWDMDYRTGVLRWSEILESQYGLQPGTFPGTREAFIERIHPDDRGAVAEAVRKAIKTGADFSTQHRALQPDGTVRWLSGAGRIHFGEHGEPVRGVGISQDVTDRRHAATALEQSVLRDVTSQIKRAAELKRHNDEIQLQRLQVFKSTMRTVQDIVNNLLNGLQLVHLESTGYVPAETLELVDRTIKEAAVKLKTLGDLETVIEKEIGFGLGIDYPGSTL